MMSATAARDERPKGHESVRSASGCELWALVGARVGVVCERLRAASAGRSGVVWSASERGLRGAKWCCLREAATSAGGAFTNAGCELQAPTRVPAGAVCQRLSAPLEGGGGRCDLQMVEHRKCQQGHWVGMPAAVSRERWLGRRLTRAARGRCWWGWSLVSGDWWPAAGGMGLVAGGWATVRMAPGRRAGRRG